MPTMTPARRWAAVAVGLALVVALPVAWRLRPAPAVDVDAATLLALVEQGSGPDGPGYSGFVESRGSLQLPVASRFTDLGTLFGEQNRLRVWWRDADAWRVDRLVATGEEDLVHDGDRTTAYDFDDSEAVTSTDPDIRLPRTADLLPPELARRLLEDVASDEATRLPTRRVAGVVAPGLRLLPAAEQSSIDHVDLWADPDTGLALHIEVHGSATGQPGLTSRFLSVDTERPSRERVTFTPTRTTEVSTDDVLDIADAANQYAPLRPPDDVAGLPRSPGEDGAVGTYGAGLTQLIAIPLRGREAEPLRDQLGITPGSVLVGEPSGGRPTGGILVEVGPLGVLLTGEGDDGGFLLAGTVTADTLVAAADDLLTRTELVDDDDDDDDDEDGGRG